ncbi:MAG: class I SAM-dependent methyltransferase [Promethearchaeota archaeon]
MDDKEIAKYWDENAENWTKLARMGFDIYRNYVNTPEFFRILPDISGLKGIDIGCGEGYNTRIASKKGAQIIGIDISKTFIEKAIEEEEKTPLGIKYKVISATNLPFANNEFEFAISTMAFMDLSQLNKALEEVYRVVKPSGFFQFSILHPCFFTPVRGWIKDDKGKIKGLMCGDYFNELHVEIDEWIFSAAPKELIKDMNKFRVPTFHRTLSTWLNTIVDVGFKLEKFSEPKPVSQGCETYPELTHCNIVAYSLIIRCRKE